MVLEKILSSVVVEEVIADGRVSWRWCVADDSVWFEVGVVGVTLRPTPDVLSSTGEVVAVFDSSCEFQNDSAVKMVEEWEKGGGMLTVP